MTATKEQTLAALKIVMAIGDTIRELGSVPSGELYARVMVHGVTMEGYNSIIGMLKRAGVVKESCHVLTWIGKRP